VHHVPRPCRSDDFDGSDPEHVLHLRVCKPTAKNAVINVNDLATMLASGDVTVNTGVGSLARQVRDVVISAGFNWASTYSLTFDAYESVTINQPVAVNGAGAVSLITNDGGSGGSLAFGPKGSLSFLGTANALTINGTSFTLENSVASLASAIASNPAGNYALANDYDASVDGAYSDSPITTTMTGTVQGLGNTIFNLGIVHKGSHKDLGFFGYVVGSVDNLHLADISYDYKGAGGAYNGAAGLVGVNGGTLFGDSVTGKIVIKDIKGRRDSEISAGLVLRNSGAITSSWANVKLTSEGGGGGTCVRELRDDCDVPRGRRHQE
jgi:hypothetical protein